MSRKPFYGGHSSGWDRCGVSYPRQGGYDYTWWFACGVRCENRHGDDLQGKLFGPSTIYVTRRRRLTMSRMFLNHRLELFQQDSVRGFS